MSEFGSGPSAPEVKAYGREADAMMVAFEAFKEANDARLDEIEAKLSADVVSEEKVDRINAALTEQKAALDRLAVEMRRPHGGGGSRARGEDERREALASYVRKGDAAAISRLELKEDKLSRGTDSEGGYLVPEETERRIDSLLAEVSPIRAIATVRQIAGQSFRLPVSRNGFASGWAAETGARAQTDTADLSLVEFPAMELYAMPAATQSLLDDALVDVESWVAEEVQHAFAAQEGAAFVNGDGANKPRGFLNYTKVAEASWSWGNIGYVATGAAGAFAASNPADALIDLAYCPKQTYRQNGRFVMSRATEAAVRKLKDGDGNYLWQPAASAGAPATLLGYPVSEAEDMPGIGANAYAIAFGDFRRGYLIADRAGVRILRDPYSAKPYVLFYTTKRVGGGVANFEAIKLLKFAAS
ncbi:MAG: phage major capsid protein [Micropepsaceae bacterium]